MQGLYGMMPQLNDFLQQSGMSLPDALLKQDEKKQIAEPAPKTEVNTAPDEQ